LDRRGNAGSAEGLEVREVYHVGSGMGLIVWGAEKWGCLYHQVEKLSAVPC